MNFISKNLNKKVLDYLPNKTFNIDASVQLSDNFKGTVINDVFGERTILVDIGTQIDVLKRDFKYLQFKPWIKMEQAIEECRNLGYKGLIIAQGNFYVIHPNLFNQKQDIIERKRLYVRIQNGKHTNNGLRQTMEDKHFQATIDKIQKSHNASSGVKANKSKGIRQIQTFNAKYTDIQNIIK